VRRLLPWTVAAVGIAFAVAGVLVFAAGNRVLVGGADFGWTSYAPLQPGDPAPDRTLTFGDGWTVLWTGRHVVGAGLLVLGLLTLSALGGWLLGSRRGPSRNR
jgi:heme/copper-type cytochrome/quinol oxidase subunit 1